MFYDIYEKLCKAAFKNPHDVAVKLRIFNSTLNLWKKESAPNAEDLHKLSEFFQISENDLINGVIPAKISISEQKNSDK